MEYLDTFLYPVFQKIIMTICKTNFQISCLVKSGKFFPFTLSTFTFFYHERRVIRIKSLYGLVSQNLQHHFKCLFWVGRGSVLFFHLIGTWYDIFCFFNFQDVHETAAGALWNLAFNPGNALRIVEEGGVPALVHLCSSSVSKMARFMAALALAYMFDGRYLLWLD